MTHLRDVLLLLGAMVGGTAGGAVVAVATFPLLKRWGQGRK